VYLWNLPVVVLFSSPSVSTPECGHNFIVPNHLGAVPDVLGHLRKLAPVLLERAGRVPVARPGHPGARR
jgi:hypothetical protein